MLYQNATPRPVRAKVTNASTGAPITADVAVKHYDLTGTQSTGDNSPSHLGNGLWQYTPSADEHAFGCYTIEFYHDDAVADGSQVTVYTKSMDDVMLEEAIRQGYRAGRDQIVAWSATAAGRGVNLAAAHDAAKAATPTSTDWVTVFIPPWAQYDIVAGDDWDTNYIHYRALYVVPGGDREHTDVDDANTTTDLKYFRPTPTLIVSSGNGVVPVTQSAAVIRVTGVSFAKLTGYADTHAYYVSCDDNSGSVYTDCYFWHIAPRSGLHDQRPIAFAKHVKGLWVRSISNAFGWRVAYDASDAGQFSPTMFDCQTGAFGYMGDYLVGHAGTHKATNALMVRCSARGQYNKPSGGGIVSSGYGSFAGCDGWGIPIDSTCLFVDAEMGDRSGCLGEKNEGVWIRPTGGDLCLGATSSETWPGEFAGECYDGILGAGSCGGRLSGVGENGKLTGLVRNTVVAGSDIPHRVEAATVDGSTFTMAGTNQDCITLLDSTSKVHNSTLIPSGTGYAINAASALNVDAVGNRYGANALGANVTNTGKPADAATATAGITHGGPTLAQLQDRTLVAAGYATAEEQEAQGETLGDILEDTGTTIPTTLTTITNRLGAWTGSGINTVLGAFKATLSKIASMPSDIGGTFDPATDSLEAIRDTEPLGTAMRGTDGAYTGTSPTVEEIITGVEEYIGGTGANTVVITVTDGTNPVQGITVKVVKGAETHSSTTDVNGEVSFGLSNEDWEVTLYSPLYDADDTLPITLSVPTDGNPTYTMTAITIPSSSTSLVTGYLYCRDNTGAPIAGVTVTRRFIKSDTGTGSAFDSSPESQTSDANGLVSFINLLPGGEYKFKYGEGPEEITVKIPSNATSPYALDIIWGTGD